MTSVDLQSNIVDNTQYKQRALQAHSDLHKASGFDRMAGNY